MKGALLERQQSRLASITPRPLRKYKNTLPFLRNLFCRAFHGLHSRLSIRPINKDGTRQRHKPAQKRHPLQRILRRDTAILRKNLAEKQNIQRSLVVTNKDRRPRL